MEPAGTSSDPEASDPWAVASDPPSAASADEGGDVDPARVDPAVAAAPPPLGGCRALAGFRRQRGRPKGTPGNPAQRRALRVHEVGVRALVAFFEVARVLALRRQYSKGGVGTWGRSGSGGVPSYVSSCGCFLLDGIIPVQSKPSSPQECKTLFCGGPTGRERPP